MKLKSQDENIIIDDSVKERHLENLADYRRRLCLNPQLRSLFIEMTLNCNEHCRHCGSRCGDIKMQDTLTDEEILGVLSKLKEQVPISKKGNPKLPFLNVTGGEPLLRPGFVQLMKACHEMGYKWGMTSNGLLIDDEMVEKLKDAGMSSVSISLDGLKASHDWFRQREGVYEQALSSIERLAGEDFYNVMVTTVVHKHNIDELEEIYKVVKATGCDTWRVINVEPMGRALEDEEIRLDEGDYRRMIKIITDYRAMDREMDIMYGCNHFLGPSLEFETRPWYFMCYAGVYTGGIFYNGDIGGCLDIERRPETIQGNVRTDDFYTTWLRRFEIFRTDRTADHGKPAVFIRFADCRRNSQISGT